MSTSKRPQDPPIKCPRCDSPNTKFCYYNNYSLTQPRHFCKTCRRYWTKGGALRNVPVGGGCRKSKKSKLDHHNDAVSPPPIDFHLAAINAAAPSSIFNHFSSSCFNLQLPLAGSGIQENGSLSMNAYSNFAASIESLSSINQDLHWKLQQQRLTSLFVEDQRKLQPNLEDSKGESSWRKDGILSTEVFFNNSYATAAPPTPAASSSNNWTGINHAWTELTHFASLQN